MGVLPVQYIHWNNVIFLVMPTIFHLIYRSQTLLYYLYLLYINPNQS